MYVPVSLYVCIKSGISSSVLLSPISHIRFVKSSLVFVNLIFGLSKSVGWGVDIKLAVGEGRILMIFCIALLHDVTGSVY